MAQMYLVVFLLLLEFNYNPVQDRYIISYERSGGFAGLTNSIKMDSDTLQADEKDKLFQLIEEADFFNLEITVDSSAHSADRFNHKISMESGAVNRTLEFGDASIPDQLAPLVNYLSTKARSSR